MSNTPQNPSQPDKPEDAASKTTSVANASSSARRTAPIRRATKEPKGPPPPKRLSVWVAGVTLVVSAGLGLVAQAKGRPDLLPWVFIGMVVAIIVLLVLRAAIREAERAKSIFFLWMSRLAVLFVMGYLAFLLVSLFPTVYGVMSRQNIQTWPQFFEQLGWSKIPPPPPPPPATYNQLVDAANRALDALSDDPILKHFGQNGDRVRSLHSSIHSVCSMRQREEWRSHNNIKRTDEELAADTSSHEDVIKSSYGFKDLVEPLKNAVKLLDATAISIDEVAKHKDCSEDRRSCLVAHASALRHVALAYKILIEWAPGPRLNSYTDYRDIIREYGRALNLWVPSSNEPDPCDLSADPCSADPKIKSEVYKRPTRIEAVQHLPRSARTCLSS